MAGRTFQVIHGDIADLECEAIVNTWNRNLIPWFLLMPHGVFGSIIRKGGSKIFRELMLKGPIPLGKAVHTSAGNLKAKYIIHVASIDIFWRANERSIRDSTRNALEMAVQLGVREIALPLIGTGSGGFNASQAYVLMKEEINKYIDKLERIYLVIYNRIALKLEFSGLGG
jgi:O-acetyl-ADP-ribose deacetylase (regulator of RNase III)